MGAALLASACVRLGYEQLDPSPGTAASDTATGSATSTSSSGATTTGNGASSSDGSAAETTVDGSGGTSRAGNGGASGSGFGSGAGGSGNEGGQAGAPSDPPVALRPATLVSVGYHHACALSSGALYCWGDNANGQLGTGASGAPELSPVRVDRESWAAVEAGYLATCALNTRGEVYCWGDNAEGQVGQGDLEPETSPVRVELPGGALRISMLGSHACAILSDHSLYCWGRNWEGELGQDDAPDAPPEPWPLRVGNASDWLQIAAGEGHTCGLRRPGTVWCWGRNTHGQVGVQSATPNQYRTGQMVLPSDAWTQVSAGSFLSCGRRPDGSASCWGRNDVGQAVPGAADPQLSPDLFIAGPGSFDFVEGHVFHACGLDARAVAHCWGRNQEGQLGIGTYSASEPETQVGTRSWASLSVGRFGTCFVSTDNGIFCTGANDYGELGLGDTMRRSSPEQLVLP